jgi:hypothetical protein
MDGERSGAEVLYRRTGPMFGDVGDSWSAAGFLYLGRNDR